MDMRLSEEQRNADDTQNGICIAKRYAVKFNPPCILLEYEDDQLKRRVRAVTLKTLNLNTDPDKITRKVIRGFPRRVDPSSVKYDQVRNLVLKLVDRCKRSVNAPGDLPTSPEPSPSAIKSSRAPYGSLIDASKHGSVDSLRESTESRMSALSLRSDSDEDRLSRGSSGEQLENDCKSRDSDSKKARDPGIARSQNGSASNPDAGVHGQNYKSRFAQEADRLVLDVEITENTDLNRVSEIELKLAKQQMEQDFVRNQVRPDDPRYEYDKQIEFGPPTESNDWDEDD